MVEPSELMVALMSNTCDCTAVVVRWRLLPETLPVTGTGEVDGMQLELSSTWNVPLTLPEPLSMPPRKYPPPPPDADPVGVVCNA